jgi:DNA primase
MTLHSIGVNAVAVRSETTPISENAYELLRARFDSIYVWFDADRAGIEGAQKISEMYDIPVLYHHASLGKDISDIYKEHGKEKLIEICQQFTIL